MWSDVRAYRRKVLLPPIEERLKQIIREVCEEHQAEIEELVFLCDHRGHTTLYYQAVH